MCKDETNTRSRSAGQYPRLSHADQGRLRVRERRRQIRFLQLTLLGIMTLDEAARALEVSNTTLDRWKRDLLADDRPDTDTLRTLVRSRRHRIDHPNE